MKISNKLLIEKLNQAINSYNEYTKEEHIKLIKNGDISNEDLKRIKSLYIDISDIQEDEKETFFDELGEILENMQLSSFYLYSENGKEPMKVDITFLSKINKELNTLQISEIDLSSIDTDIFYKLKNLNLLILGNNNINDFKILSQLNEDIAIDFGNNQMNNVSINDVVKKIKQHHGKIAFYEHPYFNSVILALKNKNINLCNIEIPENKMSEIFQFINEYGIQKTIKIEDYRKMNENQKTPTCVVISGTKDILTEFLKEHPDIVEVQIIDEENLGDFWQKEPYTREDFLQIKQKIDEIKKQIEIPDISDEDREKKIFMSVYNLLGKKIEYNYYAITEDGKKDSVLQSTCSNLKDGLLKGKAICSGYADILKNILGEFEIKAYYISRDRSRY